jgi:O-antigen/teichoic acid export membrane protein
MRLPRLRDARSIVHRERSSTQPVRREAPAQPSHQRRVRKAGFVVLIGSGLGTAVSLLVTPLISRIFEPAVYGEFALITGVVSVFVGVSTFRLEVRSLQASDDAEATMLIWLGLLASVAWGVGLTLAAGLAVGIWHLNGYWLSTGILVFLASLQLLGSTILTRDRRYRSLAAGNFLQGAGLGVVQLFLGLISPGIDSLLAGFGSARLGWLAALRKPGCDRTRISALWRQNRRFATLAGSSAFLNSLTSSVPILLVSAFYGDAAVGQLAIGIRVLVTPLSIIGQSAASANLGEVSRMLRDRDTDDAVWLVKRGMRDLLAIGLIPCVLAGTAGVWAVPFVLGQKWREAGLLLAVQAAGALAQFVVVPFSQLLNVTGENRRLLIWDMGRFCMTVLSFCAARAAGLPPVWAVGCWSAALVVVYGALARMIPHAITRYRAH